MIPTLKFRLLPRSIMDLLTHRVKNKTCIAITSFKDFNAKYASKYHWHGWLSRPRRQGSSKYSQDSLHLPPAVWWHCPTLIPRTFPFPPRLVLDGKGRYQNRHRWRSVANNRSQHPPLRANVKRQVVVMMVLLLLFYIIIKKVVVIIIANSNRVYYITTVITIENKI